MANQSNITAEYVRSIMEYDPDTGVFIWKERPEYLKNWNTKYSGKEAGWKHSLGYVSIRICKKDYLAHRLAYLHVYGKWPEDEIDHVNGNRSDNRIENLRQVSRQEQCLNTCLRSNNTTGVKGVTWSNKKNKWLVQIWKNGKSINIGYFKLFDDAKLARFSAERKYHGEYARAL